MKREIKFRAWDGDKKEMHLPEYSEKEDFHLQADGIIVETHGYGYERHELTSRRSDAWELMQYTGMQDKNGKEIYEGDILMLSNGTKVPVEFKLGSFCIFDEPLAWDFDDIDAETREISRFDTTRYTEVVGNINENPELLK